uniref:Uncharacterized protein n=1 Tax=Lygus hesperus TaxID=30085 RepID=A0A0A9YT59_LYGHE
MINELRSVRQNAAEIDEEWNVKKTQYEHQQNLLMQDIHKIDDDVTQLKEETHKNESLYHQLQAQQLLLDTMKARMAEEKQLRSTAPGTKGDGKASLIDGMYRSHEECFEDQLRQLERRSHEAQSKQRHV